MEVKSNLVQCPQGHFYNAALHSSCPYCNDGTISFGYPTGKVDNENYTGMQTDDPVDLGNYGDGRGAFLPTDAPTMEAAGGYPNMNPSGPVGNRNIFSNPTMIGGDMGTAAGGVEPVVGWLVCIDGSMRGTDYRIHAGYNYIGREMGDIHIQGDRQISRQNHAMIAFDSSEGIFYVGPSAGRNLIKVNGKTVFNAVEITSHDIISIGTTQLIFVPLCGQKFSWNKKETDEVKQ